MKRLLTVAEAVAYQKENFGYVAYSRDALYAIARTRQVPVVKPGKRRIYFPVSSIDSLMKGEKSINETRS